MNVAVVNKYQIFPLIIIFVIVLVPSASVLGFIIPCISRKPMRMSLAHIACGAVVG